MYLRLPQGQTQSYLELAGYALTKDEVQTMAMDGTLQSFVKDMQVSFYVRIEQSDKLYMTLRSGECVLGLQNIKIYRIVPPVQVNDVEGKTQVMFTAKLKYLEEENKNIEKSIDIEH